MNPDGCEDLNSFERRLTELVAFYRPSTFRWRILLSALSVCTAISGWYWFKDPRRSEVPLKESLWTHPIFTVTTVSLIVLIIFGIQKLALAPQIIISRTRVVLQDFALDLDPYTGRLKIKPLQGRNNSNTHFSDL